MNILHNGYDITNISYDIPDIWSNIKWRHEICGLNGVSSCNPW